MWTPKRIVLLASGFVLFALVYLLYSLTTLGRINTLPPLPEQYRQSEGDDTSSVTHSLRPFKPTPLEQKLELAFHRGCDELKWPVLLELNAKSMVIAAWKFEIADGGRVKLELMSLAIFGKKKNDGREIEINTLKCKQAYITFDRPVTSFSPSELSGRKVIAAELFGDSKTPIRITNNRRTSVREDDLVVRITTGPLYYYEKTQLVKTSDHVNLIDGSYVERNGRLIPPKAVIDAEGMEMELTTSAPPPRPGFLPPPKPKNESISGVKRIVLKEAVRMDLRVASGSPFPTNDKTNGTKAAGETSEPKSAGGPPTLRNADERVSQRSAGGPPAPTPEPARIRIETPGRFEYQLFKDHDEARFDVPENTDMPNSPQDVTVTRINDQTGNNDMLVCKHLELRLKRRAEDRRDTRPTTGDRQDAGTAEQGLEIETAHATGPDVTLTSDAEKLDAHGTDFFHDASTKLSILKGVPCMEANKEESLIQAPVLRIQEVPLPVSASAGEKGTNSPAKTYQQIQAIGPGSIHMTNKTTGKQTTHAYWNEKLVSKRDEDGRDLLILTGSARFKDDEHDQWLKAEELRVWLDGDEKKPQAKTAPVAAKKGDPAAPAKVPTAPASSRRPHRLEALRNVLAHSPDLNIHDAARLVVHFLDVPPTRMPPPSSKSTMPGAARSSEVRGQRSEVKTRSQQDGTRLVAPNRQTTEPRPSTSTTSRSGGTGVPPVAGNSGTGVPPVAKGRAPEAAPEADTPRPIDLSARSIEAKVLRCEERMALDHLWAEGGALDALDKHGGVVVRQAPAKQGEEGVYIEGNTLDMSCSADGNILVVTGDLARLKMDKIFILGPEVNINQVSNKAWVYGGGAMVMQSATTLEGKPLARPVPLTVHWSDRMVFQGNYAVFEGNIQAEQDNARMACQCLQVLFDRPLSLKEGMRGDQPAKVSQLVGDKGDSDQDVRVEDQTFEGKKLEKYQLLMGKGIQMRTLPRDDVESRPGVKNNDANQVTLSGPGSVRILQRGGAEVGPTPGGMDRRPANAGQEQEMKLTYITFEKQMQANNLTNVASFWEAVRVFNLPCDDPHREIDFDAILSTELPEGALFLRCNVLKVGTYQKPVPGSPDPKQLRTYQVMDAHGLVFVQGRDFTAQCDHLTFNEEKDQVIFFGEGDNLAVFSKRVVKGEKPKTMRAKKIFYKRSTGEFNGEGIHSIGG